MRAVKAIVIGAALVVGSTSGVGGMPCVAMAAGGEKPLGVFDGYYGYDGKYHRNADLSPKNDNWRFKTASDYGRSRPYSSSAFGHGGRR